MAEKIINRIRKERTQIELGRLQAELRAWLTHRRNKDIRGQYKTQLNAIESLLDGAVEGLRMALDEMDLDQSPGEVYEACRLFDLRIIWLRRVWQFFKEKFDQRDDSRMGPSLQAADEVVWSCYRQVFAQAELWAPGLQQGPAPLPFIESRYSPEAFPLELVPHDLKSDVDVGFLRDHLNQLPIPVVRLPPSCVSGPWWLVYVGHEVGHHIQYDILDNMELVQRFREMVEAIVDRQGYSSQDAERWGRWSREIFADVFSVLMMGPWAVLAMVEFELTEPEAMLRRRPLYPAPVTRLMLLAHTANQLGLNGTAALRGLEPTTLAAGNVEATRDLELVPHVVAAALGALPGLQASLQELCAFRPAEFQPGGTIEEWSRALRGLENRPVEQTLRAARLVTSATLAAWSEIAALTNDAERTAQWEALANHAVTVITQSREVGTRGEYAPSGEVPDLGTELAQRLLAADRQQLEA
jgi:hypothetical protein